MLAIWNDVMSVLKAPFVGTLSLAHLFLLVGIIIVFIAMWAFILNTARGVAEA